MWALLPTQGGPYYPLSMGNKAHTVKLHCYKKTE